MRDHYVFFSPLNLTREAVLSAVYIILRERGAVPTFECEELEYDPKQQRYHWTGEFTTCGTIEEVAALAQKWGGIATYFEFTADDIRGNLSILLWNDTTPGPVTLTLCEDSTLFNYQREHTGPWIAFQNVVISVADPLGSSFCLMKTNPPLRTVDEQEISELLTHMKKKQQVPILLAVHPGRFAAATSALAHPADNLSMRSQLGYSVFADANMGSPESESA
jgi:hypothetical protein